MTEWIFSHIFSFLYEWDEFVWCRALLSILTHAGAEELKWSLLQSTIRNSKVYNGITKSIHRALFTETRKAISWNPLNQELCQKSVVKRMLWSSNLRGWLAASTPTFSEGRVEWTVTFCELMNVMYQNMMVGMYKCHECFNTSTRMRPPLLKTINI